MMYPSDRRQMEWTLYKYSQFNIIVEETKERVLLFNTYSLRYRYLDRVDFLDVYGKSNIDLGDVPVSIAEDGFIVPVSIDENRRLKDDVQEHQDKADFMFVSIFTTLACNYSCVYCFEREQICQNDFMTTDIADEIISFIRRRYADHEFSKPLKIKWFGGEPLINMDIIRYISKELISNNIHFSAKLYTNGRLLTKDLALELKDLGVTDDVVIPIDGLAPTYAVLKGCKEEDFYKTIQNIKDVEDILKIIIHFNVSETTKADVEPLMELLRDEYKIKSNIKAVNVAPQNTDKVTDKNSISFEDFHKAYDILMQGKATGIKRTYGCEARHPEYYVVGTKGELYICEHLIGQEQYMVGNIYDQSERLKRHGTIWDSNRIIDECGDCPLLPTCLGRCTSQRYIDNIDCEREKRIEFTKSQIRRWVNR